MALIVIAIATVIIAVVGYTRAFRRRHDPEPANRSEKLTKLIALTALLAVFAIMGPWPVTVVCAAPIALGVGQICFVLAGRNPWWMQGPKERRQAGL